MTHKFGLLETLLFRYFSLCSSFEKFHEEIAKLKEIFKRNSYPDKFIDKCIKKFSKKFHVLKVVELTAARKELTLVLPYLGQQSFEIRNRIQCCLEKNSPALNLKVVFQSKKNTFYAIFFKTKTNKMLYPNLVYKCNCNICNDNYCGKTKRYFKVRACEHLGIFPMAGKKVKSSKESAVFDPSF